jgi:hypothetical protein
MSEDEAQCYQQSNNLLHNAFGSAGLSFESRNIIGEEAQNRPAISMVKQQTSEPLDRLSIRGPVVGRQLGVGPSSHLSARRL